MVAGVMKWRPWISTQFKKYEASITVRSLQGLREIDGRFTVEIRWKGAKPNGLRALSRKVKRNCTREEELGQNGVVHWDEEFKAVCNFSGHTTKEGCFNPYEALFFVFNRSEKRPKNRVMVAGPAVLDLAEFVYGGDKQEHIFSLKLPRGSDDSDLSLFLTLHLTDLRNNQEPSKSVNRSLTMPLTAPLSPCFGFPANTEDQDNGGETNIDSKFSTGSDDSEYTDPFDSDSSDDSDEASEENKDDSDNVSPNSFGYGTLVSANLAGGGFEPRKNCEDDDGLVYYSNRKPEVASLYVADGSPPEVPDQSLKLSPKLRILTWKNRKLSFKSPKVKGEPLLKKEYGERGGDDIDFDRHQLSSDEHSSRGYKTEEGSLHPSEFGDDSFSVGSWKRKEVVSRDGSMKLETEVFFASIDQRDEKAAGESACTALVAVITNWLHSNQGEMPTKSEFDSLIREGSLQWRNLCEVDTYMTRFPDKHFDLETVMQAEICPVSVVADNSFIGFFRPEGLEEEDGLGFLHGAMSFDNIWDEIESAEPSVYIVSWNDHFFVLKVDTDAYYVIDTLGERLYEGCNQAFVLKFDKDATIRRIQSQPSKEEDEPRKPPSSPDQTGGSDGEEEVVVCKGKEACKEYIKGFLAAIPMREVKEDMKKGRLGGVPLHHRLQIEFHHTEFSRPVEATASPRSGCGL